MNDEEARLAERLARDLERVLRTGILIEDLEIEGDGPVSIRAACLVDGRSNEILGEGETVQDAIGAFIGAAARLRQDGAFWQIVGPA